MTARRPCLSLTAFPPADATFPMHREFDPTDQPFSPRSSLGLYALTAVVGALMAADLWPSLVAWLRSVGLDLPAWTSRELYGFRFALIAAVLGGAKSLYGSLERLTEGRIGADLAVAIACIAAILIGEPLVAAEVVFIGLLGECLEAVTFDRTQRALRKLSELFPVRCWVLRDGQEVRVLTAELVVGDHVVVKPGGKVPVDGVVVEGQSAVDTAALTGESVPVDKEAGDSVLAGSVVQFGALTVEARKIAKQTIAGQVIELTAAALRDKGAGERLADRMARYFLPVVLGLAAATFAFNVYLARGPVGPDAVPLKFASSVRLALYPTLAVLVVACPCPLVLATPAAVIAALGRLAGTGVLIKGGAALERLASVTAFAFDKTGTLTLGKLELGELHTIGSATGDELLRVAALAEQRSEHPIARAILAAAGTRGLTVESIESFQAHPGAGVSVRTTAGATVLVGSRRLLEERQVTIPHGAENYLRQLDADGQTSLLVARDGVVLGVIGMRDTPRPEAAGVLSDLMDLGIRPIVLLTGDRESVAKAVAKRLPLTEAHAELFPAQKAEWVANAGRVAFVGDGINDAPALARATVGVAIGTGTDIAAEAGDVVMMGDPLRPLPLLVRLSRKTVQIIHQNIVWFGFGVNLVGVVVTGWLWPLFAGSPDWFEKAPLIAVLYHQIGSLAVLANSMRLLAFERTATDPTATRIRNGYRVVDAWLERLNPDDLLHEAAHHWRLVARVGVVCALAGWLLTGLTQVNVDEVGVVRRFGAVRADLAPGLHIRWPWLIEEVSKIRPDEVRTVEVGFRVLSPEKAKLLQDARIEQLKIRRPGVGTPSTDGLTWSSAHSDEITPLSDESMLVTGDGYLVELLATVRYSVDDPRAYLFGTPDPDTVLRSAAESVFRELAASRGFFDLLTTDRPTFEARATSRLDRRLAECAGSDLGVRFEGVTVHDLHPLQEVVKSFHDVATAIQRRDQRVNEAGADATRTVRRARQAAVRLAAEGRATATEQVASVTAARDVFLGWAVERSRLTHEDEAALAVEFERRTKSGESAAQVTAELEVRRQAILSARRQLTEFRLTTDAAASTLTGRDKVFIDADALPGKRHLIVTDPAVPLFPPVAIPTLDPRPQ